jgi:cell division protein FtsW (lipid II flippase)
MRHLADSHSEFAFSIALEEPGIAILCLALLAIPAFFVIRRLWRT